MVNITINIEDIDQRMQIVKMAEAFDGRTEVSQEDE